MRGRSKAGVCGLWVRRHAVYLIIPSTRRRLNERSARSVHSLWVINWRRTRNRDTTHSGVRVTIVRIGVHSEKTVIIWFVHFEARETWTGIRTDSVFFIL